MPAARPRLRLALLALATLLGAGCATVPPPAALLNYTHRGEVAPDRRDAFNARVFVQVSDWIGRRYYDPAHNGVDWPAAVARHRPAALAARSDAELYTALNALLGELRDEHTRALSPREVEQYRHRRSMLLGFRTSPAAVPPGARRIVAVFPDSPAARAGVRAGWLLLAADGRPPIEVLGVGRLAEHQLVRCDFRDESGQSHTLDLRAERLSYPTVRDAHELPGGVLLLAFDTFDLPAARWVRAELKSRRPRGLILDLRGNSGGEARALAAILAEIFPEPVAVGWTRARGERTTAARRSPRHPLAAHYDGPLAVLVSEASASAAEILAAIVQQERRGTVLGTATPGNVLVCVRWPLPGGGELQLSVYDYVGPDGRRLEGRGVAPDQAVAAAPGAEPDPQVEAARQALLSLRR